MNPKNLINFNLTLKESRKNKNLAISKALSKALSRKTK